jgi:NTE family protein
MLSGGGALGPFHVGVVKALHQQDLLPNVISGASAGSLVAALIGTRSAAQLAKELAADALAKNFSKAISEQDQSRRTLTRDALRFYIEQQIPDMTFAEALEVSGRRINISISPREIHQQSRLMNAVTSPNVLIRETVLASCAIPGVFDPVTLAARNANGKRQAYIPSRQWVDGSITDDLPSQRLSRLYGVNHLITSQTNPIVLWALQDSQAKDTLLARFWEIGQNATRDWLRATYPLAVQVTKNVYPLNLMTRLAYGVATQSYTADINILPRRRFWNPAKLLAVWSPAEIEKLVSAGEMSTWPKMEMIRNCTAVSRKLDEIIISMDRRQLARAS